MTDASNIIISVKGLKTAFGDFVVHENLDLDVREGEIIAVVGGSGTGKSVLMRTILGLNPAREGAIRVFDTDILKADERDLHEVDLQVGVLFQSGALFSSMTVLENVLAPVREHLSLPWELQRDLGAMKIAMVGLPRDAANKFPSELSGGMRKRAGLARALAMDPKLVFLDEPTAGLDPIGAAKFDELIVSLKDSLGLTVFIITHDLDTLYAASDRVAVLADRKVIAVGPLDEVRETPHPWIQEYFSGPRGRAALKSNGTVSGRMPEKSDGS